TTSLADRGGEDGCVDANEASIVEEVVDRLLDFVTDTEDRLLARASQPQVKVVHQEIDTVLLWLNGVIDRTGAKYLQVRDANFDAAGRSRVDAHFAGDGNRRFLRE